MWQRPATSFLLPDYLVSFHALVYYVVPFTFHVFSSIRECFSSVLSRVCRSSDPGWIPGESLRFQSSKLHPADQLAYEMFEVWTLCCIVRHHHSHGENPYEVSFGRTMKLWVYDESPLRSNSARRQTRTFGLANRQAEAINTQGKLPVVHSMAYCVPILLRRHDTEIQPISFVPGNKCLRQ